MCGDTRAAHGPRLASHATMAISPCALRTMLETSRQPLSSHVRLPSVPRHSAGTRVSNRRTLGGLSCSLRSVSKALGLKPERRRTGRTDGMR